MKSKKLRNHLRWLQQHTYPPCRCTLYRSEDGNTLIHMSYESDRTFMWEVVMYDEDKRTGEIFDTELCFTLDVTNTALLMKLMAAHDGYGLLNAIKNRFCQFQADTSEQLTQYCKSHGVIYNVCTY